jgi:hypothetical protein
LDFPNFFALFSLKFLSLFFFFRFPFFSKLTLNQP